MTLPLEEGAARAGGAWEQAQRGADQKTSTPSRFARSPFIALRWGYEA